MELSYEKTHRILSIYSRLRQGQIIDKNKSAVQYHVSPKSIQRDFDDLRAFLQQEEDNMSLQYDAGMKGYYLTEPDDKLSNSEILAVCKILLESRSLVKEEMLPLLDKLVTCCVPKENKKAVSALISNEKFHYIEPHHGKPYLNKLWDIGQAIQHQLVIRLSYERLQEPRSVERTLRPVGILFSEYYFYLTAFIQDNSLSAERSLFPTIYRIDRIQDFKITNEHFSVPYKDRFEEGEFRKRVQFMFGGKLRRIKFKYTGLSLEAVLDRLPTAEVVETLSDGWIVTAEVFGDGVDMWFRSQGERLTLVK